ncbi:MAG: hypothetical protein OQK47_08160 [Gammaproteobacteria bacterium]|nr:hypothetical protein [Gammaproteobacteria bacterium]
MSLTKKGSRTISVAGNDYLWQIRRKPNYDEMLGESNLSVAIQLKDTNNSVLVITCNGLRPDAVVKQTKELIVTPKHVEEMIISAIKNGWEYNKQGSAYNYEYKIT